jgi:hypothetical protein
MFVPAGAAAGGLGTDANSDSVNQPGRARRAAAGPCTRTWPERSAWVQVRSPRQTCISACRSAVRLTG